MFFLSCVLSWNCLEGERRDLQCFSVSLPIVFLSHRCVHMESSSDACRCESPATIDESRVATSTKHCLRRFSVLKSTEENHRDVDAKGFYGTHGQMRKILDCSYHGHYRKERQWLHDAIIEDILHQDNLISQSMRLPVKPWLILVVGVHGAGKHNAIRELVATRKLPLLSSVCIDTDDLRHYLPEYSSYLNECPEKVHEFTRREAVYIAATLALATLYSGRNAMFHCSLKDREWYQLHFIPIMRSQFSELKVGLIHVTASPKVALDRACRYFSMAGRTISEESLLETLQITVPNSVELLKCDVDACFSIENSEGDLMIIEKSWQLLYETFRQAESIEHNSTRIPEAHNSDVLSQPQGLSRESHTSGVKQSSCIPRVVSDIDTTRRNSLLKRRFSALSSSEENYAVDNRNFYGQFSHIRETLDYEYHRNYTFERQLFHDSIIREFLDEAILKDKNGAVCTTPTKPWIVFTAGAMGAGKGYTMRKLVAEGRFPLLAFVRVDPDAIRRYLPEYHLYVQQSPELAGERTNKEAGMIAEILTLAGLQAGKNVIVDGSLRRADWYCEYFARLRREFVELRIAIIHVTAPRAAIFQRAESRAKYTGRLVPRKLLIETLDQVPHSVRRLAPLVDYHVELLNSPDKSDIELVTSKESWSQFTSHWAQTCAWVPKSPARLLQKSKQLEEKLLCDTEKQT